MTTIYCMYLSESSLKASHYSSNKLCLSECVCGCVSKYVFRFKPPKAPKCKNSKFISHRIVSISIYCKINRRVNFRSLHQYHSIHC